MEYDMIIFDIDGTLWEASEITMIAANMIADEYPEIPKVTKEQVDKVMGLGKVDIAKILMPSIPLPKALEYVEMQVKKSIELINKDGAHIYDGVIDVIKDLSKRYKLGIVTNNYDDYCKLFIEKSGLNDYFVDFMGCSTYGITKTDAIKTMVQRNNVSNACYIGDIKKDMIAARDAGIDFIHAKYGFEPELICDKHIDNITDLMSLSKKREKDKTE